MTDTTPSFPHDGRPELREFIAQTLEQIAVYSRVGADFAWLANDAGIRASLKSISACLRVSVETLKELEARNEAVKTAEKIGDAA